MNNRNRPTTTHGNKPPSVGLTIFYGLFSLVAFYGSTIGVKDFFRAREVRSWPTADGVILQSEMKSEFIGVQRYEAQIKYRFTLDDKVYTSNRIRVRGASQEKRRGDIPDLVSRYPRGAKVKVFYSPKSPKISYLEARIDGGYYILIFAPLLFGLAFGGGFVSQIKKIRDYRRLLR